MYIDFVKLEKRYFDCHKILCNELYNHNQLMVGYGSHKNKEFVRLVSINRENTKNDILNFFKVLEKFAEDNF